MHPNRQIDNASVRRVLCVIIIFVSTKRHSEMVIIIKIVLVIVCLYPVYIFLLVCLFCSYLFPFRFPEHKFIILHDEPWSNDGEDVKVFFPVLISDSTRISFSPKNKKNPFYFRTSFPIQFLFCCCLLRFLDMKKKMFRIIIIENMVIFFKLLMKFIFFLKKTSQIQKERIMSFE